MPVSIFTTNPDEVVVIGTVDTKEIRSTTPTQSSVNVTIANTVVLASNVNRLGGTLYNEGPSTCYVKLGGTASLTSFSVAMVMGAYYEFPFNYIGAIDGITSAATSQLRITELT